MWNNQHFLTHTCICISFLPEQWGKNCTKLTFYFTYLYVHILPTLSTFHSWWGRKDWNEANWVALSFLYFIFPVSSFSALVILRSNRIKKGCDRIPRSFMFLRVLLPYFLFQAKSWFNRVKHGLWSVGDPAYSVIGVLYGIWPQNSGGPTIVWVLVRPQ